MPVFGDFCSFVNFCAIIQFDSLIGCELTVFKPKRRNGGAVYTFFIILLIESSFDKK